VTHVVVIGESVSGSERAVALAKQAPGLSATVGVHPHEARAWNAVVERRVRALLAEPEVVAVGETGLDYHYDHSPREDQRRAFEAHFAIGAELGKPVVVHARDADADVAAVVRAWGQRVPAVVLHSFASAAALFAAGMDVGAYFSFSGMITFKNWRPEVPLTAIPAGRLLVETDAPYLAPVPHRGRRNEPAFVREVALALARARQAEPATLLPQLAANARAAFGERLTTAL
jgi:TatD DNase family protein